MGAGRQRPIGRRFEHRKLDAGRAGVEDEDRLAHSLAREPADFAGGDSAGIGVERGDDAALHAPAHCPYGEAGSRSRARLKGKTLREAIEQPIHFHAQGVEWIAADGRRDCFADFSWDWSHVLLLSWPP